MKSSTTKKPDLPLCQICGMESANITAWKRSQTDDAIVKGPAVYYCYDCGEARGFLRNTSTALKSLLTLAGDLREHANAYAFDDGQLAADLRQAANYLEAVAKND